MKLLRFVTFVVLALTFVACGKSEPDFQRETKDLAEEANLLDQEVYSQVRRVNSMSDGELVILETNLNRLIEINAELRRRSGEHGVRTLPHHTKEDYLILLSEVEHARHRLMAHRSP